MRRGSPDPRAWLRRLGLVGAAMVLVSAVLAVAPAAAAVRTISGRVTDIGGHPIADVTVTIWGDANGVSGTTGADGRYAVPVPRGYHYVYFEPAPESLLQPTWWPHGASSWDAYGVEVHDDPVGGIDAVVEPGGGIAGTVTMGGTGLAGAEVWAFWPEGAFARGVVTGPDGRYLIGGLPPGALYVYFDGAPVDPTYDLELYPGVSLVSEATPVPIALGAVTDDVDGTIDVGATLTGTVADPGGGANAMVYAIDADGFYVRAGDHRFGGGGFAVTGVAPGTYRLAVAPDSWELWEGWWDDTVARAQADPIVVSGGAATPAGPYDTVLPIRRCAWWDEGPDGPFPDVYRTDLFCEEIDWLAVAGVAGGYPDGTFRPAAPVSRQALAAFLYRYLDTPPFTPPVTPTFSDVPTDHPFFAEIEWLAAEGIAGGYPDGTFRPSGTITRQAMAAMLHRLAGEPSPDDECEGPVDGFSDVPPDHPFREAIDWMVCAGITTGYSDGTFRPAEPVTRQATAAFLYRFDWWLSWPHWEGTAASPSPGLPPPPPPLVASQLNAS